jgi:prepilin-type N-terminal cleavage/methylation domain-containing protein
MNRLRALLAHPDEPEAGLTLIEVLVAMMIFSFLAVGVAYSMIAVLKLTNDARSRQTAANLAAAEIDADRASTDVIDLGPHTTVTTVDGVNYTVAVTTGWVTTDGGAGECSSGVATGTGALLSKRINVAVTWAGMGTGANPVRSATIVSPDNRITDINKGVIVVSVLNAAGAGSAGVTINVTPASTNPNGATAITGTIAPTDADGCGIVLQVIPGNYVVSISKTGSPQYVDVTQNPAPTVPVTVAAGGSATAQFQYDQSAVFTPNYHSNLPNSSTVTVTMPTAMDTSFVSTNLIYTSNAAAPFFLHPFASGYTVLAGSLAPSGTASSAPTCLSVDPGKWGASADGTLVSISSQPVPADPGKPVSVDVPMGIFTISGLSGSYVKAVGQKTGPAGTADPGCSAPSTYVIKLPSAATATVALPFGSWKLTSGTSSSQTAAVAIGSVATTAPSSVSAGPIVTLDPRVAPVVAP